MIQETAGLSVILGEAKDLVATSQILRFAQDDRRRA
jgi:hypothetical protein